MFLSRVENWTSVVGTNIPFATVINTNDKIKNNLGNIELRRRAVWDIDGAITLTGVAGNVIVTVVADGEETGFTAEVTTTADGFVTVPIVDAVRTILSQFQDVATIGIRVDTAGLTVSGTVRVEYVD